MIEVGVLIISFNLRKNAREEFLKKIFFFFGKIDVDQRVGDSATSGVKVGVLFEFGFI